MHYKYIKLSLYYETTTENLGTNRKMDIINTSKHNQKKAGTSPTLRNMFTQSGIIELATHTVSYRRWHTFFMKPRKIFFAFKHGMN